VLDRAWDEHADRWAAKWAPTINPRLGSSLDTFLLERRLLDEVNGRARVWLPDDWNEDE
jgi:hypothetical protein